MGHVLFLGDRRKAFWHLVTEPIVPSLARVAGPGRKPQPIRKSIMNEAQATPQPQTPPTPPPPSRTAAARTLQEAISEAQRELRVRERCFGRWVEDGKLDPVDATDRLERLQSAVIYLEHYRLLTEDDPLKS